MPGTWALLGVTNVLMNSSEFPTRSLGLILRGMRHKWRPISLKNFPGFKPGNNNEDSSLVGIESREAKETTFWTFLLFFFFTIRLSPFKNGLLSLPKMCQATGRREGWTGRVFVGLVPEIVFQ